MDTNRNRAVQSSHQPPGRHCGERNSQAKLTAVMVTDMRRKWLRGRSCASLAVEYDVAVQTVSKIMCNQRWAHVPWPDPKEVLLHDILGVPRAGAVATALAAGMMVPLLSGIALGGLMVGPGSILRAVLRMRFWPGAGAAEERRKRRAQMMLLHVGPKPEPPDPDGCPAEGYRDSGDEAAEEEQEITWPPHPLFGLPPVYPKPLRDWTEPREFRNQAVPVGRGDRAWADEDVRAIRGSKRFQLLIGGRADGGGDQDQGEERQA